jgi:hypothetical protein
MQNWIIRVDWSDGIKDGRVEGQITIATNGEQATEDT